MSLPGFIAITAAILLLPMQLHAQAETAQRSATSNLTYEPTSADGGLDMRAVDLQRLYDTGATMRNIGIGMTSVGAVLLPLSFYFGLRHGLFRCGFYGDTCTAQERADIDRDDKIAVGSLIGGVVTLGAGIPLWAVGVHRMHQAQRMGYAPVSVVPFIAPTTGGAVAGVTLTSF